MVQQFTKLFARRHELVSRMLKASLHEGVRRLRALHDALSASWNRCSGPDSFRDELATCFDVIGHTPQIGRLYRPSPVPGIRRILLKSGRYDVYYIAELDEVGCLRCACAAWRRAYLADVSDATEADQ
jgi:plasmid stabilization system protein ParE